MSRPVAWATFMEQKLRIFNIVCWIPGSIVFTVQLIYHDFAPQNFPFFHRRCIVQIFILKEKGRRLWEMLHFSSKHIVILLCMYLQSETTEHYVVLQMFISSYVCLFRTTTVFLHCRKKYTWLPWIKNSNGGPATLCCSQQQQQKVCPRFFDQVGHQTSNASIGNRYFFTK